MKQVIDGKLYDTEEAEKLTSYQFSHKSDFNYTEEHLYKTENGNYFLYGAGGPNSK